MHYLHRIKNDQLAQLITAELSRIVCISIVYRVNKDPGL
jgi:hypothetical protein